MMHPAGYYANLASGALAAGTIASPWSTAAGAPDTNGAGADAKHLDVGDASDDEKDLSAADAEGVWSPDIEQSFQEALAIYPPCGRRKIILSDEGKMYGRNELIARYIKLRTGKTRTRKQVSSHIQVLARRKLREIQAKLKVQFWQPGLQAGTSQDVKPFPGAGYKGVGVGGVGVGVGGVGGADVAPPPPWEGRAIATHKLRLVEFSAFVEHPRDPDTYPPSTTLSQHLFVHIGGSVTYADPLLESVDVQQINDKFPEKKGGLKELYEKGPRNAFFLVKFWADLNTNNLDDPGAFYGVTSVYESNENMTITCSTKVCSFGKQVVEKVETEYARFEGGRFVYRIHRSPMCEYMVNFIHKLKHLPEKYMMNSVLENFTILQMGGQGWCLSTLLLVAVIVIGNTEDLPCRPRDVGIAGRSIVCVCDAAYCDTITREEPAPGTFVVYTSSHAGQRFEKSFGVIETSSITADVPDVDSPIQSEDEDEDEESLRRVVLRLYTLVRYQFIEGFGGSVTDAAAINWRKLSDAAQVRFINSYFSSTGLEYNLIRVPIGGADFSTHPYTYNEEPWYDHALSNFSLTSEDNFFKLPMIKRSQAVATDEVKITASTWSPPVWMKTNERITGFGQVRPEYYQSYADYHIRFMEEYEKAEVKIWAITTTNEPINGVIGAPFVSFNSLGWTPRQLGRWVANNLGPTVRNSRFNSTLILAGDDQRYTTPIYLRGMEQEDPKSIEYIDGIAIHYYGNFIPAAILTAMHRRYPGKILLSTEACEGPMPWDRYKVELGSWDRARKYAKYILQDLNNYVVGWIDWNLCLDPEGGPNWAHNYVDAPILVYGDQDEFIKQPMFYAMGHFSKFIPRGSRRIQSSRRSLITLQNAAFLKPDGNIVMVLQNTRDRTVNLRINISATRFIELLVEPLSIKTIEINHN